MRHSDQILFLVALILGFNFGCTQNVPPSKSSANSSATSGSTSDPAALSSQIEATYDPAKDPLVNPPSLFEPYPANRPETVNEDETLFRLLPASPATLNPIFTSSMYDSYMNDLLFDTLFLFDNKFKWFVNSAVVESFEESEDHLVNTVRLKPGLKWHDGHPWTAEDVRFSWEAIIDDRVPCPAVKTGTEELVDVKVLDELTFQFAHKEARPTNIWNMLFPIIPKHIYGIPEERQEDPTLQNSDYYNKHNREVVVGNGPYKLVRWETNSQIIVERWDEYHGEKPHFKRQILKIHKDRNTALLLFKRGEIDEMELTSQQFATQTNDPAFTKIGYKSFSPQWTYTFIGWNMDGSNPFFADKRVRRAMTHAINIEKIINDIEYNLVTPAYGMFHPDAWMFNKEVQHLEYDPDTARRLLDEAGWKVGPDGWRSKEIDGEKVVFEFELLMAKESATIAKIASRAAEDLKKIGVKLKQRVIEFVALLEKNRKHEFHATTLALGTGTDPDTNWNLWHSSSYKNGRNYVGYKNPEVDKLFELGRKEMDHEKRAAYYQKIHKLVYDDQPFTFLWNRGTLWALNNRLRGITTSPRGVFGVYPSHLKWWVPKTEAFR